MTKRVWISIGITAVTVSFLFTLFDPRDILEALRSMSIPLMVAALATQAITYLFRAKTFSLLIPERRVRVGRIFWIHCIHNFLNMVLPARTGEISYVVLLRSRYDIPAAQGLSSLLVTRLLDLATIPVFFILALITWSGNSVEYDDVSMYWKIGFALGLLAVMGLLVFFLPRVSWMFWRCVARLCTAFNVHNKPFVQKILQKGEEISASFRSVGTPRTLMHAGFWALMSRLANFCMLYLILAGGGFECGFWQLILGSTAAIITNVLPINGVGSFGPFEGGWAVGFVLVGFSRELALQSGFFAHIMALVNALVLFGASWANTLIKRPGSRNASS